MVDGAYLALNCRLQVEQVSVKEIGDDPFTLALCSMRFLSASQILFLRDGLLLYALHNALVICNHAPPLGEGGG